MNYTIIAKISDQSHCFMCNNWLDEGKATMAQFAWGRNEDGEYGTMAFPLCEECCRKAIEEAVARKFKERFVRIGTKGWE